PPSTARSAAVATRASSRTASGPRGSSSRSNANTAPRSASAPSARTRRARCPAAEERFAAVAEETSCRMRFIRADFAEALEQLHEERVGADLVYMDLGMSSMHVDTWARGFSYAYDAPLDMRMDPAQELTAADIVNTWDERQLARLFREYGEERVAPPSARAIGRGRGRTPREDD